MSLQRRILRQQLQQPQAFSHLLTLQRQFDVTICQARRHYSQSTQIRMLAPRATTTRMLDLHNNNNNSTNDSSETMQHVLSSTRRRSGGVGPFRHYHYCYSSMASNYHHQLATRPSPQQQQQLLLSSKDHYYYDHVRSITSVAQHPANRKQVPGITKKKNKDKYAKEGDEYEELEPSTTATSTDDAESSSTTTPLIKRFQEKDGEDTKLRQEIPLEAIRINNLKEFEAKTGQATILTTTNPDVDDPCPPWQNPLHHNNPDLQRIFPEDFPGGVIPPEAYVPAPPVKDVDGSGVYAPQNVVDICHDMLQLNMLEMAALHQKICLHFGFPYDDPLLMSGGGGSGGSGGGAGSNAAEAAPEPEPAAPAKTVFDVKLMGYDEKSKIKVIKEVRAAVPGLGLKEAKEMVEGAPKVISKDLKPEQAEELKKKLQDAGAIVEIV